MPFTISTRAICGLLIRWYDTFQNPVKRILERRDIFQFQTLPIFSGATLINGLTDTK
jgi:hypothetical protein